MGIDVPSAASGTRPSPAFTGRTVSVATRSAGARGNKVGDDRTDAKIAQIFLLVTVPKSRNQPLGAMPLDRVNAVAIEGTADNNLL
jgi:hypothetical protein